MPDPKKHGEKRNWIETIGQFVPGFRGYLKKEYRRESDHLAREWMAERLQRSKSALDDYMRHLVNDAQLDALPEVERIRTRLVDLEDTLAVALRKQTVAVDFTGKDPDGHGLISYNSTCGPATEKTAMALLRYNMKMVHGAFAIHGTPAGEMIVVQANQLAASADALEVTRLITAVAWQADKAEETLGGGDQH